MKVLLSAVGSRGDVQPLAVLAAGLMRAGHEALLAIPPDGGALARAHGVPFVECGRDVTAWLAAHEVTRMSPTAIVREFKKIVDTDLALMAPLLVDAAQGASVVVAGGLQALGGTVADVVGAVSAYAYYGPNLLTSGEHPPLFMPAQRLPRFVNRALHTLNAMIFDRVVMPPVNRERAKLGLAPHARYLDALPRELLFAWDAALSPLPADFASVARALRVDVRPHFVGALQPSPAPLDPALAAFVAACVEQGTPCVYVGFGSMPDKSPAATLALVDEAARDAGVRAVLLAPLLGAGLGSTERVHVVTAVSHAALFPRMHAIVHHAGAGTTAAAARGGVPQVAVPHFLDQPMWALRLQQRGVSAGTLARNALTARALGAALRRSVEDTALRARAAALRDEIATTDPVATGVRVIESLGAR